MSGSMNASGNSMISSSPNAFNMGSGGGLNSPIVKGAPLATNLVDVASALFNKVGFENSNAAYGNISPPIAPPAQLVSASAQVSHGEGGLAATSLGTSFHGKGAQGVG